jgi:polyphosphate kinase 2 (PPK2 family)
VASVMGFATSEQVDQFYQDVPLFEKLVTNAGIVLLKFWFSIEDNEQELRFLCRIHDPLKQWKLSLMDLQSRARWEDYTKAKERILFETNFEYAPWRVGEGNEKKRARLNCIRNILETIPYEPIEHEKIELPERVHHEDYHRRPVPEEMKVPRYYS